jgi:TATA-binding protein-associated factor
MLPSLQAFKLDVASAVVNADNVSMADMDTGALLDLFGNTSAGPGSAAGSGTSGAAGGGGGSGLQAVLASMGEMWDEAQYATQFDTAAFARKLGTASDRHLQRSDP